MKIFKAMSIITFNTTKGPKPLGPYSTAKIYGGVMYVSGNLGISPQTGELVSDKVEDQAQRTMENLKIILQETKSSFENVLKCTVYLKDMNDFTKVNEVYGRYFTKDPPARVAIAVAQLPKGAKVEIDATVAYPSNQPHQKQ